MTNTVNIFQKGSQVATVLIVDVYVMLMLMMMLLMMRLMVMVLLLTRRGCAKMPHSQGLFPQEGGLPKSTHAPTAEFAWSQPARAFGLKTLQKKVRKRKGFVRTQCPFQEVRGNLGQPQDTLI